MNRFFGYFRSSAAYRCRIAFALKGFDYELVPIHLRLDGGQQKRPDYRAINPQALVPTLETPQGLLTQSLAIIEWLEEVSPSPPLLPGDPYNRALIRGVALAVACDIHPLQNLRVLEHLRLELGHDQTAVDEWCRKWIGDGLAACEALLERNSSEGPFAFGAAPTLADVCIVPQLYSADRFGLDLSQMPRLQAIGAAGQQLPAFAQAHPDLQPDASR